MKTMDVMERPPVEIEEAVYLPADLSDWVSKAQLREWVVEHVNSMNWDNPELNELLRRNRDFEPKALLCTITLAYAIGHFGAEDVMRACSRDPQFRPIRPNLPPRVEDFSAFRKFNRVLIQETLHNVMLRALKTQFVDADEFAIFPASLGRMAAANALDRLNLARHIDRSHEF
jgi:transposase